MHKPDTINNVHYLITDYSHDKLTTDSVIAHSNRLVNTFINTTCIAKDIKYFN